MNNTIRLLTSETGDWETLYLNERLYAEGHHIPNHTWINLFYDLGYDAMIEDEEDKEME